MRSVQSLQCLRRNDSKACCWNFKLAIVAKSLCVTLPRVGKRGHCGLIDTFRVGVATYPYSTLIISFNNNNNKINIILFFPPAI